LGDGPQKAQRLIVSSLGGDNRRTYAVHPKAHGTGGTFLTQDFTNLDQSQEALTEAA
jgi:hypothetical protein